MSLNRMINSQLEEDVKRQLVRITLPADAEDLV